MKRMNRVLGAMLVTLACGCGDSGGGGSESSGEQPGSETGAAQTGTEGGTEPGTTGEPNTAGPTTAEPTGEATDAGTGDDATTGGPALTPAELVGSFASGGCESYPNGMGGNNYLTRAFTLTEATWHLDLVLYADEACATKLFTAQIDGPYTLLGASAKVAGATEGDFAFTTIVWTAHLQQMADTFTMSGCGSEAWEVEVPQDVTATGCIGVAHPIATCPVEHDVVALDGDDLYFGERVTDMCSEEGRPAALGAYPVVRA